MTSMLYVQFPATAGIGQKGPSRKRDAEGIKLSCILVCREIYNKIINSILYIHVNINTYMIVIDSVIIYTYHMI